VHPGRLNQRLCGLVALLTLTLALTSVPRWRASDAPFLLLAVSPYLGPPEKGQICCAAVDLSSRSQ
jgi:hypothetical protein